MLGQAIKRLFPPERNEEEEFILHKLLKGEKIEHFETERICKDGRIITISATISPIRDSSGRIIGASQIARNMTERKQTEDELRKLWLAVEQSPNSIIITNLNAEIEYVNQRYCESSGYSRAEILGKNPKILKSPDSNLTNYGELWETLIAGNRWQGEFHNRRKDGSEYIAYAYITPVRQPDNKITHYLSIQEDITEKKQLETELDAYRHHLEDLVQERTAELENAKSSAEAANQAKTIFLTNMSHEIRTPMNAILGLTYLLQQDISDAKQYDRLTKVGSSARHLLGIINDILDLSKIEANRLVIEEIPFNVSATLNHVCSMMADRAKEKGITLHKTIAPRLKDLPLVGDPLRIGQILINYISNALKFTEKGSVTLRADIDSSNAEGFLLRFEVQDTGIGLTEEQQGRIFKAFEQAENSTTREFGGTGLGLTICQKLAHLLGGEVGVRSLLGEGSVFWVTLQVKLGKEPVLERPLDGNARYKGTRVLLVEDNEINQEVALEMLKSAEIEVIVANHGGEAVEQIKNQSFDLIFMDMQMPIMDGIEATRQIRKLANGVNIPIIAMTANAFSEDRQRCFNAGMNDFIAKPVNPDLLFKSLSLWISASKSDAISASAQANLLQVSTAVSKPQILNADSGLRYFSGKVENYQRMLDRFIHLHGQDAAKFRLMLDNEEYQDAQRLAHSLKGIADTLGAELLKAQAETMENYFKTIPEIDMTVVSEYIQLLDLELQAVESAIHERPSQPEPANSPVLDQARLEKLASLLADDDLAAESVWRETIPMLSHLLDAETLNTLDRQMRSLDLQGALHTLQSIKQTQEINQNQGYAE